MTREEKDKLIELSDLNREDNIKYISSEAQGIAITLDSDRYAPTFCKLERAYICGRRKSEEQIADIKANCDLAIEGRDIKIKELENKIADIKANCDLAIEGRDVKIMELEKENAELKTDNDARKFAMAKSEKVEKHLREQLSKATEIIKELVRVEYADFTNGDYSNELSKVLEQGEQFLEKVK